MSTDAAFPDSGWRFNKQYKDTDQVAPFLPAFKAVLAELEAAGQYRYNTRFQGRIPGIEGPDEDTAIYLLQHLEHAEATAARAAALVEAGYVPPTGDGKYASIITYDPEGSAWTEYTAARLVTYQGRTIVLPKGKRTHGYSTDARTILVKP